MSHTPGPWKWVGSKSEPEANLYLSAPDGYAWWNGKAPEDIANARLIAAAPELLEALRQSDAQLVEWLSGNNPHNCIENTHAVLDNIRALIRKATS